MVSLALVVEAAGMAILVVDHHCGGCCTMGVEQQSGHPIREQAVPAIVLLGLLHVGSEKGGVAAIAATLRLLALHHGGGRQHGRCCMPGVGTVEWLLQSPCRGCCFCCCYCCRHTVVVVVCMGAAARPVGRVEWPP